MVVMEWLSEEQYVIYRDHRAGFDPKLAYTPLRNVRDNFLTKLHQESYVHGDVRDVNLMVAPSKAEFRLSDFDWVRKIGHATVYPMGVYSGWSLQCPQDARDNSRAHPRCP